MSNSFGRHRLGIGGGGGLFLAAALSCVSCGHAPPAAETVAPTAVSSLKVSSAPSSARVHLDGDPTPFVTPAVLSPLPPGEHLVALSLNGYRTWEQKVTVGEGESLSLSARLEAVARGSLSISSVPFQSWIFIDGRSTPWVTPTTLYDLPVGTHTVVLRREGYEDWSQAVIVLENRQMVLKASLKPAKGVRGNLNIQSHPPRAEIFVDGYPTNNRTPVTLFNLLAGLHTVQLKLDGYDSWKREVTVPEDTTSNLLVTLERSRPVGWGEAEVASAPPGAKVFLNDIPVASRTPVFFESITQGVHKVRIEKEGFEPWDGEITVRTGEKSEISVPLKPALVSAPGVR